MPTDKQIAANRLNAQKSTGPKTEAGKHVSSLNAITHGIRVSDVHLTEDHETLEQLQQKLDAYLGLYKPQNVVEIDLVKHIVFLEIRLDHCHRAYQGLVNDTKDREFAKETYRDPTGATYHRFDSANAAKGREDEIDDQLLGHSMGTIMQKIELMNRYENRMFTRIEKLTTRLEKLIERRGAGSQPAASPLMATLVDPEMTTGPISDQSPAPATNPPPNRPAETEPRPKGAVQETNNDLSNLPSPLPGENRTPPGAFNAGVPFTDNGKGGHVRAQQRQHDMGFSVGGPVWLPKLYNGRNKTFFFFNYEYYRDIHQAFFAPQTVPTDQLRGGDLSPMLVINGVNGRNIGTDPFGRAILQNQVYDPLNFTTDANGRRQFGLFANNIIPASRIDPVATKVLNTIPKPTIAGQLVNNYQVTLPFHKLQPLPSIKIDHQLTQNGKISGYYSTQHTNKDVGQDGLPFPISTGRVLVIRSHTARINYDHSLTPTTLIHMGAGITRYRNPDSSPPEVTEYDSAGILGIQGAPGTGFPRITGFGSSTFGGFSGRTGPVNRQLYLQAKPTAVFQLTHIRGNHSYKIGGEWKHDNFANINYIGYSPNINFGSGETSQPLYGLVTLPSGTGIGSGYASMLLGLYGSASAGNASQPMYQRSAWGFFIQDTWKVNRKLTLDYGLRWDLQPPERELWRRQSAFRSAITNAKVGLPGAIVYDGSGTGRCNCDLMNTYPYAVAPRIGLAYQLNPKTVLRAGWGLSFSTVPLFGYIGASSGTGFNTVTIGSQDTTNNVAAGKLSSPLFFDPALLYGASYDPALNSYVTGVALQNSPGGNVDPNGGRPPRVNQWNFSLQRELRKDLVVEAAYVGNRGVWFQTANSLINYNTVNPTVYKQLGFDLTSATDRSLLTGSVTAAGAVARGFRKPYALFPDNGTVVQSLKPFPQYNGVGVSFSPLGKTWYDALQVKVTKRYSHGLNATLSYAYAKNLVNGVNAGDLYDRSTFKGFSAEDRPHILTMSVNYTMPLYGFANKNGFTRLALAGWTIGSVLQYQSGQLLGSPGSNNGLTTFTPGQGNNRQIRVAGQPLFLKNPNCDCIKPDVETILNPAAWTDVPVGANAAQIVYYNDFHGQRRPTESLSIGKRFALRKNDDRMSFSIRMEFFNVFNRMESLPDPGTGSPQNPPTRNAQGILTGGFGFVNFNNISSNNQNNTYPAPRAGQIVARFEF